MSTNTIVPPTPFSSPLVDNQGKITVAWANWLKVLYLRVGGASAPSNSEIGSITTLQANVAALQLSVATINTSISTLTNEFDGLSIGRQL